jgi:hypothetical protein
MLNRYFLMLSWRSYIIHITLSRGANERGPWVETNRDHQVLVLKRVLPLSLPTSLPTSLPLSLPAPATVQRGRT